MGMGTIRLCRFSPGKGKCSRLTVKFGDFVLKHGAESFFSSSRGQEISRGSFLYVHSSPLIIPLLSQINPVYDLIPYFFTIHFNITLLSTSRSKGSIFISHFATKFLYVYLMFLMHALC
jgi:hypothetical protein